MQLEQDTIVAISTPPGRGGIGVVRLSGERARAIAESMLRLPAPLAAGRVRRAHVLEPGGAVLDQAVVTLFAAPHSYTTEDVVEIATHGSPVVLEAVLRGAVAAGARLAEAGEFTQRAFLSGRLDLTQAEAVQDLIAAQTLAQVRLAASQMGGSLARAVGPHKQKLVQLIAQLEAGIDFAEDDLDPLGDAEIAAAIEALRKPLAVLAETFAYGRILREGFTLAIVGRPNAGKSSLFNRLLDRERAIVTAQPGTTRDALTERLSLQGIPVEMVDTAGLREVGPGEEFEPERQGIARSRTALAEAGLVLHVIDMAQMETGGASHPEDDAIAAALAGRPHLRVLNKLDLAGEQRGAGLAVSALNGDGIEALHAAILRELTHTLPESDTATVTSVRQHQALTRAVQACAAATTAVENGIPHEMLLLDLYTALEGLDALTGTTSNEDVLRLIFSTFCIGK